MSTIKWILYFIININSMDISSFIINFFEQNTKLYYINSMYNDNGDIYFEFWGEDNSIRYFIGKGYNTEENILFNDNEIYSIDANTNWNYHESILINYNDDINILSINSKNFDYINFPDSIVSSKLTSNLINSHSGDPSYRNCLIKLKNENYLSSIILKVGLAHNIFMTIFEFNLNHINGFNKVNQIKKIIGYLNSTSCFQTDSEYIQCSFSTAFPSNQFTVGIYDLNLNEKTTVSFGYLLDYTFTKIFHINGEIGGYIFFDDRDNNVPKLFLKNLNDNKNGLINLFSSIEYIILNNNGNYILDYGLFSSDAIKIDDLKFVVIFSIKDSFDLLICLCDFNKDYTGIRIRYYRMNLSSINIKISVNIRTFKFKEHFGLLFYDSNSQYPGYIFFNYPKIISENKINSRSIKFNILVNTSNDSFSFQEHLQLINIIYTGQIKIKIINYISPSISGIKLKTSNSEISNGDKINFDDIIIFEPINTGAVPGEYFLEFFPYVEETDSTIELYGEYQEGDFEEIGIFSNYTFNLNYTVECHEKCETCYQLGSNTNYHCAKYKNDFSTELKISDIISDLYSYLSSNDIMINFNIPSFTAEMIQKESINTLTYYSDYSMTDNITSKFENRTELIQIIINNILNEWNLTSINNGINKKITEKDLIIILTSTFNQKKNEIENNITMNLGECENILKYNYNISNNDSLYILQIIYRELGMKIPKIEYEVYYPLYNNNLTKLNLTLCQGTKVEIIISVKINDTIDKYNSSSGYYNDICYKATSQYGTDISLKDRRKEFIDNNISLCEENCELKDYNYEKEKVICSCDIKFNISEYYNIKFNKKEFLKNFIDIKNIANLSIIKCYKVVLKINSLIKNYGFFILFFIFLLYFITLFIFWFKSFIKLKKDINNIIFILKSKEKNVEERIDIKKVKKKKIKKKIKRKRKIENINLDNINENKNENEIINKNYSGQITQNIEDKSNIISNKNIFELLDFNELYIKELMEQKDFELNSLDYEDAFKLDRRSYFQYYISLIKNNHSIIFSFSPYKDYNSRVIKMFLFFFSFSLDFTINALFFNDNTMHKIYEDKGKFNFLYQIPQILYSTIISRFIDALL